MSYLKEIQKSMKFLAKNKQEYIEASKIIASVRLDALTLLITSALFLSVSKYNEFIFV